MKKSVSLLMIVMVLFLFTSCATVFKGNSSKVKFNSDPQGARIFINGEYYGETPQKLRLHSGKNYVIEFRKKGFNPVVRHINSRVGAGWVILDVLVGLVPVVIDALTGSWYHLDQRNVSVILQNQQPH